MHHPGSGSVLWLEAGAGAGPEAGLELLRDHCSGRLTPCCNAGQHALTPQLGQRDRTGLHTRNTNNDAG